MQEDITRIHQAFRECKFTHEQLNKFFKIEQIRERLEQYNQFGWVDTLYGDVHEKPFASGVMDAMAMRLKEVDKAEKKQAKKLEADKAKLEKQQ